jgi:hypothetical protein
MNFNTDKNNTSNFNNQNMNEDGNRMNGPQQIARNQNNAQNEQQQKKKNKEKKNKEKKNKEKKNNEKKNNEKKNNEKNKNKKIINKKIINKNKKNNVVHKSQTKKTFWQQISDLKNTNGFGKKTYINLFIRIFEEYKNNSARLKSWGTRKTERTKLLKLLLDIICGEEKHFVDAILTCFENNIQDKEIKKNVIKELKNRLEANDEQLSLNLLKFCLESDNYATKKQMLSFFQNTKFSFKDIESKCNLLKNTYPQLKNKTLVSQNTFASYMKHFSESPQNIGKLIIQTRNKFFLPKEKIVQILYSFCIVNSESIPNSSILINKEKEARKNFKGLNSHTAVFNSFIFSFENGFGEHEDLILTTLNENQKQQLRVYRENRKNVKILLSQFKMSQESGGKLLVLYFYIFIFIFLFFIYIYIFYLYFLFYFYFFIYYFICFLI